MPGFGDEERGVESSPIHFGTTFKPKVSVDSMSVDDMRILLKRISKAQPSFVLNILDNSNVGNGQPAGPEPPKPDQPSWCSCSNCREMPTQQERLCCKRQPMNCHSRLPNQKRQKHFHLLLQQIIQQVQRRALQIR
ncbi:Hypothetical predicted protein [Mytilus galloprovincialis]|uniref:P2X purinoreceptor 7 intracellular domain-containing protein n=1 Tax=Mytilus galloprovincialis TaxID=29158 RepID=A0A8B6BZX0_MYTGA|nr:Hypothetical predicted protein [Mytilus galloprovincialis]